MQIYPIPELNMSDLLSSVALFIAFFLFLNIGMLLPETTVNSTCRDKIVGFEQRGMYTNSGQFKLALSYCEARYPNIFFKP